MKYTLFCPCHTATTEVNTPGVEPVKVGDEMMCATCSCIHRVHDVEPGQSIGVVRLERMSVEDVERAYAELGSTLITLPCPICAFEVAALGENDPTADDGKTAVLFCPQCSNPMIIEGEPGAYTARRPDTGERHALLHMALGALMGQAGAPSTAARLDDLFPDTPFGDDPFAGGAR